MFFTAEQQTLFKVVNGNVSQATLPDRITSLSFDSSGVLWGTSGTDDDNDGFRELYIIEHPFSATPSLQLVGDFLTQNTASIEWVGGVLYGSQTPATGVIKFITIDPGAQTETTLGATGYPGVNGIVGTAYDATGDVFYAGSAFTDSLYTMDYALGLGPDPSVTLIGGFGLPIDIRTGGLAYDNDEGALYSAFHLTDGSLGIYEIDTANGAASLLYTLPYTVIPNGSTGIAVIPEPSAALLLAAGAVLMSARRRRIG